MTPQIAAGIEYVEAGQGPPVICLHGIGGDWSSFAPQLGALPARVISWSMPGYGASVPIDLTFEDLSASLAEFMKALGVEEAHLVGQSIGGMVAMEHAARRPDQVLSLSLIGTTPSFGGRDDSFKTAFLKARLAPLDAGQSMAEMAAESARNIVGPIADAACIAAVEAPMARVPEGMWRAILPCLTTFNRRDDLSAMAMPACLIAGTHDKNAPARTMEKMREKMPNATYHLIDGAGHMINQEAPGEVNQILTDFLRSQS
mgnify:CR=1 FL=1